jgi:hypothetical protein
MADLECLHCVVSRLLMERADTAGEMAEDQAGWLLRVLAEIIASDPDPKQRAEDIAKIPGILTDWVGQLIVRRGAGNPNTQH